MSRERNERRCSGLPVVGSRGAASGIGGGVEALGTEMGTDAFVLAP
jgi:hypothetical protein